MMYQHSLTFSSPLCGDEMHVIRWLEVVHHVEV